MPVPTTPVPGTTSIPSGKFWTDDANPRANTPPPTPVSSHVRQLPTPKAKRITLLTNNTTYSPHYTPHTSTTHTIPNHDTNNTRTPDTTPKALLTPSKPSMPTTLSHTTVNQPPQTTLSANHICPLSRDTTLQAIDSLKKKETLQNELKRHNISSSGNISTLKKRLRDHVKTHYSTTSMNHKHSSNSHSTKETHIPAISNSIKTLESSILNLTDEITSHQHLVETALLDSNTKTQKNPNLAEPQLSTLDKRIESIEDYILKLKESMSSTEAHILTTNSTIKEVMANTKNTLDYLRTPSTSSESYRPKQPITPPTALLNHTPTPPAQQNQPPSTPSTNHTSITLAQQSNPVTQLKNPSRTTPQPKDTLQPHNPPSTRNAGGDTSTSTTHRGRGLRQRKAIIICDSQLNKFDSSKFSKTFDTTTYRVYTYKAFLDHHQHQVMGIPGVECYVVELGVNDLKDCNRPGSNTYHRVLTTAQNSLTLLLTKSRLAKVCVCLPTSTPMNVQLNNAIKQFNKDINEWVSGMRSRDLHQANSRLFTIDNTNFDKYISENRPCPYSKHDMLHVNDYGLKKLSLNIKFGMYRAFGHKCTYRPNLDIAG